MLESCLIEQSLPYKAQLMACTENIQSCNKTDIMCNENVDYEICIFVKQPNLTIIYRTMCFIKIMFDAKRIP